MVRKVRKKSGKMGVFWPSQEKVRIFEDGPNTKILDISYFDISKFSPTMVEEFIHFSYLIPTMLEDVLEWLSILSIFNLCSGGDCFEVH